MNDEEEKQRFNLPEELTYNGKTQSLRKWAKEADISPSTLSRRLRELSIEEALALKPFETPLVLSDDDSTDDPLFELGKTLAKLSLYAAKDIYKSRKQISDFIQTNLHKDPEKVVRVIEKLVTSAERIVRATRPQQEHKPNVAVKIEFGSSSPEMITLEASE